MMTGLASDFDVVFVSHQCNFHMCVYIYCGDLLARQPFLPISTTGTEEMESQNQNVIRETTIALLWHVSQQHARIDMHDSRLLEGQYSSLCALRSGDQMVDRPEITSLWLSLQQLLVAFGRGNVCRNVFSCMALTLVR